MTISDAISAADALLTNSITTAQKTSWLINLDALVYKEILSTHDYVSDAEDASFLAYLSALSSDVRITDSTEPEAPTGTTELLMSAPYDEAYIYYLLAKMYFAAGEYQRYNNAAAEYGALYSKYADYINKNYAHKSTQKITLEG